MPVNRRQKLFGVGPVGCIISLVLFIIAAWVNHSLGNPQMLSRAFVLKVVGVILIITGLGLHFWSMWTLRRWWHENELCVRGPFRWFRHPLYAGWLTFVLPGISFYMNSWILLFSVVLAHVVWHILVRTEEDMLLVVFGERYKSYAVKTGRFIPRLL